MADRDIKVEVTGPEHDLCIAVEIGPHRIFMHTLSAIDLQDKLAKAICDWTAKTVALLLTAQK